ncbi:MAG: hypothetical protein AAGU27_03385 [Dehalobacterium sp.]
MPYICPSCKKTKKFPDYCCGEPMLTSGTYYCPTCGYHSVSPANCCGNTMVKL